MSVWDYTEHPGDCHPRVEDKVHTVCCAECAGTGVFPCPWLDSIEDGKADPDNSSCVRCKGSGRALVSL